jgi:hypothetical protein
MNPYWTIIKKIIEGLNRKDVSNMMEFEYEDEDEKQSIITFHTDEEGNLVLSVFDTDQWSLIEDMSEFAEKPVEDIIRELDPSGPNIHIVNPDDIEQGPGEDF